MPGHPQTWDRIENCSNVQEIVALSVVATDHSLLSSVVAAAFATGAEPIDGYFTSGTPRSTRAAPSARLGGFGAREYKQFDSPA
jgi:hypothetical protein